MTVIYTCHPLDQDRLRELIGPDHDIQLSHLCTRNTAYRVETNRITFNPKKEESPPANR